MFVIMTCKLTSRNSYDKEDQELKTIV